jgi:rod shape-determining protein MreC
MKFLKNKLTVTIVLLSVTFLILISQSVKRSNISFAENGVGVTLNSVQSVFYSVNSNIRNSFSFIFNISNIKAENIKLIKRNSELESKALDYDGLKSENDRLRSALNFTSQQTEYNYVGGDIIGKSGGSFLDQFVLNKGSKDGIAKGMIAITDQGLVGQISSVGTNWSVIQSLANENLAVSGMVLSTGENSGIVKGYISDSKFLARLDYLPIDSKVKKNDVIMTSGLGGVYPKGIRIGYVTSVQEDQGRVVKVAVIQPYVDLNKIQEVIVVIPKNKLEIKY